MNDELGVLFLCDFQPLVCEDSLVVRLTYILGSDDGLFQRAAGAACVPTRHLFSSFLQQYLTSLPARSGRVRICSVNTAQSRPAA